MRAMFYGCKSISQLIIPDLKAKNLGEISEIFCGCSSLTDLDFSKFSEEFINNYYYGYYFIDCSQQLRIKFQNYKNNKKLQKKCIIN